MHFHEVFVCIYKLVFVQLKPYDFHLWSHDKLEISFSRLHATCNLADYVLGIGAQGRQASEASTLEPGIPHGVGCGEWEVRKMARSPSDIIYICSRWVGLYMLWCCRVIFDLFLPEVSLFFCGEDWDIYFLRNGWGQYWIGILGIRDVSTRKMFGRKKYQPEHGDCYSNQIGLPPLICGAGTRKIYILWWSLQKTLGVSLDLHQGVGSSPWSKCFGERIATGQDGIPSW